MFDRLSAYYVRHRRKSYEFGIWYANKFNNNNNVIFKDYRIFKKATICVGTQKEINFFGLFSPISP